MTEDLHALTGAYVLDAVDDIERAAFLRHMSECEACAAEVAEFREVAARLGDVVEEPPPTLKANVLATIGQTRQVGPPDPPAHGLAAAPSASDGRRRDRKRSPSTPGDQRWRRATLATAAAAVVAIAGTWALMDERLRHAQSQVNALQADRERIYAVMNAKDVTMLGANLPDGGRLAAAVSPTEREGVAMFAGLPPLPADRTYEMWLIAGDKKTKALLLPTGVLGGTALFAYNPDSDTFAITNEPAQGSNTPTSDPLATITLR
jgi:anti-sigma-K factor RskA